MENVTKFAAKMLKTGMWPLSNKFETFDIEQRNVVRPACGRRVAFRF